VVESVTLAEAKGVGDPFQCSFIGTGTAEPDCDLLYRNRLTRSDLYQNPIFIFGRFLHDRVHLRIVVAERFQGFTDIFRDFFPKQFEPGQIHYAVLHQPRRDGKRGLHVFPEFVLHAADFDFQGVCRSDAGEEQE